MWAPQDIRGQGAERAGCWNQKAEISALRFIGWRDLITGQFRDWQAGLRRLAGKLTRPEETEAGSAGKQLPAEPGNSGPAESDQDANLGIPVYSRAWGASRRPTTSPLLPGRGRLKRPLVAGRSAV